MGEIEKCIESGAVLSQPYQIELPGYDNLLPVIYAIVTYCDPVIVKRLHDAWWEDSTIGNVSIITYVLKRQLQKRTPDIDRIYEYARIFNVYNTLLDESKFGAK
jgi:hypothetical protein